MDEHVSGVLSELSHHSCGFLFGVLHDDGHLLFDITDELVGDAWLGVQNCATNVDAVPEESTQLLLGTVSIRHMTQPVYCHLCSVYLDGYCSVFRFQPFDVSALDRRKISKTSEPIATTDTSGSPNTNTPFTFWTLSTGKGERTSEAVKQTVPSVCTSVSV